jgi:hypothetical protein
MNFKSLYDIFHGVPISCDINKQFEINRVLVGSGGSNNIILDVLNKEKYPLIIKVIPSMVYHNVKKNPDYDQLEIKFYQFFTKKYLLTDRTPHIVGIYGHQHCDHIDKLINSVLRPGDTCPTYTDKLTKQLDIPHAQNMLCDLLLRYQNKLVDSIFDLISLEYCSYELNNVIDFFMDHLSKSSGKNTKLITSDFMYVLDRILFQLIFTLAIIKDDYPGFLHGDFFIRNILISLEQEYQPNDYVAYHYKQKIFYLPANGEYAKINDFGYTLIVDELVPNVYDSDKHSFKLWHKNPFNHKTDIFNLLHDLYDGQGLGTTSINTYATILKIPNKKMKPILEFLSKYIKIDEIDKINKVNKQLLDDTWDIDELDILENTVQTPDQYLMKNTFKDLQVLPEGANIVKHYNQPK